MDNEQVAATPLPAISAKMAGMQEKRSIPMPRRLPHATCAVCDRPQDETGGVRLVATPIHAIQICTPGTLCGLVRHPSRTIQLDGDFRDVIVALSGSKLWTDHVIERVRGICQAGHRPWFCQRCAGRDLCPHCGSPLTAVPGADHMLDCGKVVHSSHFMGFGGVRRCSNPECDPGNLQATSPSEGRP